jgi:hypothetical protein
VAFSPDGTIIASASQDASFALWNAASGTVKAGIGEHGNPVYYSMFRPDGKHLIAGQGNHVKIYDTSNGSQIKAIDGFTMGVYAALYSPDGRWIAAACGDGTVRFLDASDYSPWFTLIGFTGEEWLTLLPQNYYYGSANGDRYLNARVGNTVSGADRYRQNLKPAALALGMRVSMDLAVLRFLEPNNRAAISRVEGRLQFIAGGSAGTAAQVSRAEIEAYYRQNIGALVATVVTEKLNENRNGFVPAEVYAQWKRLGAGDAQALMIDAITRFFLEPTQANFRGLVEIHARQYHLAVSKDLFARTGEDTFMSILRTLNNSLRDKVGLTGLGLNVEVAKLDPRYKVFSTPYR